MKLIIKPATLIKKRLWHRCLPVYILKLLRVLFHTEHLWWLLLFIAWYIVELENCSIFKEF